jgi:hypothetical protein
MEQENFATPVEFKKIEELLNNDDNMLNVFLADPVDVFDLFNVKIPDNSREYLTDFAFFIKEKIKMADPVTMIYE